MLINSFKVEDLPDQTTQSYVEGRVMIYDADSLCYRSSATVKKLSTAINRFKTGVLEMMYLTESQTAVIHLTHKDSDKAGRGRIKGVKPYQENRTGAKRPPLLHELRDAVVLSENVLDEYTATMHHILEADDACMIDSYKYKGSGLLVSEDKDLRQTPYPFYDPYLGKVIQSKGIGTLWEHVTEGGNSSLHGIGRIFFWAQMLMGDTADNIGGLQYYEGQRIGYKRTYDVLLPYFEDIEEHDVANKVIDAYREIDQNPFPEGYLLHMMRSWDDSFYKVVKEIDWSLKNKKFLAECATRDWFDKE